MQGKVFIVNHRKEWIAVLTSSNTYTIMEVLGTPPKIGANVSGELEQLGLDDFRDETSGETFQAFVQDIYAGLNLAKNMLDIRPDNRNEWEM